MSPGIAVAPPDIPNYGIDSDRLLARGSLVEAVRRRVGGHYAVDEFGGDPHLQDFVLAPIVGRIPVRIVGGEHLLDSGPALLVANRGPASVEPLVLCGAVQRLVGRRLRVSGLANPPVLGAVAHKLGAVGRHGIDVASVLRAGHLAAVPLGWSWRGAGEAPRGVVAATLGFPVVPVALSLGAPLGLGPWRVRLGTPLLPPEGTLPGDPLAAAELAQAVRAAIVDLLDR